MSYGIVVFLLTQKCYYFRQKNWAKPNNTCEANITGAANRTRRKANITEKNQVLKVQEIIVIFRLCRSDIMPYGIVIFLLTQKCYYIRPITARRAIPLAQANITAIAIELAEGEYN